MPIFPLISLENYLKLGRLRPKFVGFTVFFQLNIEFPIKSRTISPLCYVHDNLGLKLEFQVAILDFSEHFLKKFSSKGIM